MELLLPEEKLIEYAKPYLKSKGFKKKQRGGLVDYEADPVPAEEFLWLRRS